MRKLMVFLCLMMLAIWGCGRGGDDGKLKVGYVVNYMSHEWYQNICKAARQRATEMGVDLVIADANLGIFAQRPEKVYSGEEGSPHHAERC